MVAIPTAFEWKAAPCCGAMCVREGPEQATGSHVSEPRLLDRVGAAIRLRHYSRRTERAYTGWIRRFILFHGKRHPSEMAEAEITRFLSHLAVAEKVSASTQNQALSALLFLYRDVLGRELPWMDEIVRAKRPQRLPVVLSREEVAALLSEMKGVGHLMASLLYGSGLRLLECCRLRVKDIDLVRGEISVRDGKGGKDRITLLPNRLHAPIAANLERVRAQHERDLASALGSVELPAALDRKYPHAAFEWSWQWVFPATRFYWDAASGRRRRHHLHESVLQRAVHVAAIRARLARPATCHALREAYA